MDPRVHVIDKRLGEVRRILAITGGKGGTGKSVIASTLALLLAERGSSIGLLDLDLTGASDHVILGARTGFPREEFGVDPPSIHGIRFMSVTCFSGGNPTPLRGADVTHALLEILAITRWGRLDFLVIDMPPGLGDVALDALRLLRRAEYLAVATPSRVVLETVRNTLRLHVELRTRVRGVVENMQRQGSTAVPELARRFDLPYLGALPRDDTLEEAIGDPVRLSATPFAAALRKIGAALLAGGPTSLPASRCRD